MTGAIFFDFRKAFDVVSHEILLRKRKSHKFDSRAMKLMRSYLYNRKQCIVDNMTSSSMQEIKSGVQQGSVQYFSLSLLMTFFYL